MLFRTDWSKEIDQKTEQAMSFNYSQAEINFERTKDIPSVGSVSSRCFVAKQKQINCYRQ